MTEISPAEWMEHANRRLDDAQFLLGDNRRQTATSQVYFALYYACRALLETRGYFFQRHASVTSNVGRVEQYRDRLHTSFPSAMQYRREQCDYELVVPDRDEVGRWIDRAASFIAEAERLLEVS